MGMGPGNRSPPRPAVGPGGLPEGLGLQRALPLLPDSFTPCFADQSCKYPPLPGETKTVGRLPAFADPVGPACEFLVKYPRILFRVYYAVAYQASP